MRGSIPLLESQARFEPLTLRPGCLGLGLADVLPGSPPVPEPLTSDGSIVPGIDPVDNERVFISTYGGAAPPDL
jgi:hypothetical protein